MHVSPSELRTLRQDGIVIRFALLGTMAYVLAELPATGSAGTAIEEPCSKPHWGFVLDGIVEVDTGDGWQAIPAGSAFHVPAGSPAHRFRTDGAARIAGFELVDPVVDTSDAGLIAQGFELPGPDAGGSASVIPTVVAPLLDGPQIDARTWPMSSYVLTQARFGPGSGYTSEWCDAPHWGLVTAGRLAIEWEDDIEIVAAGDIFHCQAGPPGHRLEAADPASVVDLTPLAMLTGGRRLAPWREAPRADPSAAGARPSIAVAGLG